MKTNDELTTTSTAEGLRATLYFPHHTHYFCQVPELKTLISILFQSTCYEPFTKSLYIQVCAWFYKGKVRSADAFHFVILCKWCACNCLPSVPRSGNSLHEASPTEPAPEQSGFSKECQLLSILASQFFTFILFQNKFLEGWTVNMTVKPCTKSPFSLIQFVT